MRFFYFCLRFVLLTGSLYSGIPASAGFINPAYVVRALATPHQSIQPIQGTKPVLVHGAVKDETGVGLANVPVTDGATIVRTDAKGNYQFYANPDASFVYITVPAGFEVPQQNQLAAFYVSLLRNKEQFLANFTLQRMKRSDKKHFTIVWADPQINSPEHAALLRSLAVPDTRQHAQELSKTGPVLGISAGDITWDNPAIIPAYKTAVRETGIPFFQVLGNHDMDINVRTDEKTDSTFRANFGPAWYSFNRGEAHYIVLDNVFYYSDGYNYIGYITERQFKWLEQDLAFVKPGSLVFVSMHISAYTEEKRRYKRDKDNPGNITFNRRFLFDLLKPFKAHLLTGHTHYNENRIERTGVVEHIHAALCSAWWTAPVCDDGTPGGYGVYAVDGNELTWYYKSLGHEPDYQFRAYGRGVYPDRPADIAANVWNWDPAWKVNWYQDGVFQGEMKQGLDYDAEATRYMKGPDKPAKYPWVEPRLTDHIFFATPAADARSVKIVVTDRFGKEHKQEINLIQDTTLLNNSSN